MKVAVVGLGKIGLPLAVQFAGPGHRVVGADIDDRRGAGRARGRAAVPRRGRAARSGWPTSSASGALEATTDTATAVSASDVVVVVVPLYVDADGVAGVLRDRRRHRGRRGAACGRAPWSSYETTLPVGHHPQPARRRCWRRGSGLRVGVDLFVVVQPGAGLVRPGLRRPRPLPQARRRGRPGERAARRRALPRRAALRRAPRPRPARTACGTWARPRPRSSPSWPRPPTGTSTSGWPTSSRCYADRIGVDVHRVIEACNSQPFSHLHSPGIAVGGHCIPVYPWFYLAGDPDATIVRAARTANSDDARAGGAAARRGVRRPRTARPWWCSAPATAAGSRRPRSPGCSRRWTRCAGAGRAALVHDPLFGPGELAGARARAVPRRAARATPRSCRPTTPSTATSPRPTCPGSPRSSTGGGCSMPTAGPG